MPRPNPEITFTPALKPARFNIEFTQHEVALPYLPPALKGTRLAQLSDLHVGCGGTDELINEAIGRVNALEADYVVVTGDFVDRYRRDVLPAVKLASGLRAKRGVLASVGNHDHRADLPLLMSALEAAGFTVLYNRAVEVEPGLWFAGVDELYEGEPDLEAALQDIPKTAATVLLAHHPNTLDLLPTDRSLLVLSGHTHGAQIVVPFPPPRLVCRYHLQTEYIHGWFTRGNSRLYVNRGIGVTGNRLLARRFRCLPEITLFELN
jgi:predicted MPP superfamily phosphohydrolase